MDLVVQEIESRLSKKMTEYFPAFANKNCDVSLRAVKPATYSTVYFFQVSFPEMPKGSAGIVVKIYPSDQKWCELSNMQYGALRTAWSVFEYSQTFGSPRPLDIFSAPPALVMEQVLGRSLQSSFRLVFWSPRERWIELVKACTGCGQWLQYFHKGTMISPRPLNLIPKRANVSDNLFRLEAFGFSSEVLRRVEASLGQCMAALTDVNLPSALVHGDFTADNILIGQSRICAIDITGRDQNAVYHDIATFLNSIAILKMCLPVSTLLIQQCQDAFLSGYFGNMIPNRAALLFLRLAGLISVALEILGRRGNRLVARWWLRRNVEHILCSLIEPEECHSEILRQPHNSLG